ncbi:MAG: carotenoid biosynthesis protein [bacterium]
MEFVRTYPYLVANVPVLVVVLFTTLFIARGPYRRSALLSGLICLPAAPLALLHEGIYWSPVRWGGGHFGIEDVLFAFLCGCLVWLLAAWPFRCRLEIDGRVSMCIRRYLLITALYTVTCVLLWYAGLKGLANTMVGATVPVIVALILRRTLWPVAALGVLLFVPLYTLIVKGQFLLWPDFVLQWNRTGQRATSLLGIPITELEWAVAFAMQWPLLVGYILGVRIRSMTLPVVDSSVVNPPYQSLAGLRVFALLAMAACLSCIPFLSGLARPPWSQANLYLQSAVFLTAATFFCHAWMSNSFRDASLLLATSSLVGCALECASIRCAFFCGSCYQYDAGIALQIFDGVPVCVLLMWFVIAYTAIVFLRPFAIRVGESLSWTRLAVKASLCGFYMVAVDVFLDPLAVTCGLWTWENPGPYFTVPLRNFVAWFVAGMFMCGGYLAFERPQTQRPAMACAQLDFWFVILSLTLTTFCFCASVQQVHSLQPTLFSLLGLMPFWIYRLASFPVRLTGWHPVSKSADLCGATPGEAPVPLLKGNCHDA